MLTVSPSLEFPDQFANHGSIHVFAACNQTLEAVPAVAQNTAGTHQAIEAFLLH